MTHQVHVYAILFELLDLEVVQKSSNLILHISSSLQFYIYLFQQIY